LSRDQPRFSSAHVHTHSCQKAELERGKMPPKTKQAEEERLLLESSRHVTRTASALFYGNGFIVSALPLCTAEQYTGVVGIKRKREKIRKRGRGYRESM
jgi:hypothetical protein